jgi:hypothetical protein
LDYEKDFVGGRRYADYRRAMLRTTAVAGYDLPAV